MSVQTVLDKFHAAASNPKGQLDTYLTNGEKVVLVAPVYTPEEIIHSMGLVPMGAWGADTLRINHALLKISHRWAAVISGWAARALSNCRMAGGTD